MLMELPCEVNKVPEKYTVTMGDETTDYAVGADVTIIAPAKAGETFTGWDAVGVPEGTDTNSETITFKMPANNVTLTPQAGAVLLAMISQGVCLF